MSILQQINQHLDSINSMVWGLPMLAMLGLTGAFLTLGLRLAPWRRLGYAFGLLLRRETSGEGEIHPAQALFTALSATVGIGNIAGVATAIALGGPGAVFYMWLIALFGMATKYAEAVCAVTYRQKDEGGAFVGGPMYYLRHGVGAFAPRTGRVMGLAFALFGAMAAFGIGNATQVHSMADIMHHNFQVPTWVTGILVAALVGFVVIGGIRRIGEVAGRLVPLMVGIYLLAALAVILINIAEVPAALGSIFQSAFTPAAAAGGFGGAAVAAAIRFGVERGIFSNESGLGSAAIAHAAARTDSPVRQGLIAMLGTFIDTLVVCTMTALVILSSGAHTAVDAQGLGFNGAPLTSQGFMLSLGASLGGNVVALVLPFFAFTTIIGWAYYGERCWQYLFGARRIIIYRVFWVAALLAFANVQLDLVWNLSGALNGLMVVPNLVGLILLAPMVFRVTDAYFKDK